jgi:hypothetical protein
MIDEILTEFYEATAPVRCEFGHIYRTPAYYPHENLQFWRPAAFLSDVTKSQATTFEIHPAGDDRFSHSYPLRQPKLDSNEEFVVVKAKIRPVILLIPECPIDEPKTPGFRSKIWRPLCLVGQVFGLSDPNSGIAGFSPSFVDRIRRMEFPHLMFLPRRAGLFSVDSILRLDECQSAFTTQLTHSGFMLTEDLKRLLRSQLGFMLTGEYTGDYQVYRELILADAGK